MSKHFIPIEFNHLLFWIINEFFSHNSIFGIPSSKFYNNSQNCSIPIFNQNIETPIGPAAGPHTQLAQNIIASYLVGGRFIELKTVQALDSIAVSKPCIDAEDECYNVEWSQELSLDQSFDEYLKAWFAIFILSRALNLSYSHNSFIFNMSLGYDYEGICSVKMDKFINLMLNASGNILFEQYKQLIGSNGFHRNFLSAAFKNKIHDEKLVHKFNQAFINIDAVSPNISNSVTLSTMHGCPPNEIEKIGKYLIGAKNLNTFIKLNPTLLRKQKVEYILANTGFNYLKLNEEVFEKDLRFNDAVDVIKNLKSYANLKGKDFGVKLSNTLGLLNNKLKLPGSEMYMSGRALYPLSINLAYDLAKTFNGNINISFSGGANSLNINDILSTGIYPVTLVTDLLKPGGYLRLFEAAKAADKVTFDYNSPANIKLDLLKKFSENSITNIDYKKEKRKTVSLKIPNKLKIFDCYIAPCVVTCPINQNIPEYIRLIEEGKFKEACEIIAVKNPLPNITSYICDHQCTAKCSRWDYDSPIAIRELKKEAVDKGYQQFTRDLKDFVPKPCNNINVAIIGAGPAGLSAAYFLAVSGFNVTIFERSGKAGGTVSHIIPEFRIPRIVIDKDIEFIKSLGVNIFFNSNSIFDVHSLKQKGYKYIFIGIGASLPTELYLDKCVGKTLSSIDLLRSFNDKKNLNLGKTVAVIGGGNSAMDSARAALRIDGIEKVFIVYRRTKEFMPADKEEFENAVSDGVLFKELLAPISFDNNILKCQKMKLDYIDIDGRRNVSPVDNEFEYLPADSIITAIGEHVESELLLNNRLLKDSSGSLFVNPITCESNIENVYIGGDAYRGPSTVAIAIADGKKVVEDILFKEADILYDHIHSENFYSKTKYLNDALKRKGIVFNSPSQNLLQEASRCLACNLICNKCVEVCPNRANVALDSKLLGNVFADAFQVIHIDGLCNECGNCETFCPYSNAPYNSKLTIFWSENSFHESNNSGFFIKHQVNGNPDVIQVQYRFNSETGKYLSSANGVMYTINPSTISSELEILSKIISGIIKYFPYLLSPSEN